MRSILFLLCIFSVTLTAKAQLFGRKWVAGSYYDLSGKKTTGLLSWSPPQQTLFSGSGDRLFFKTSKDSTKIKVESAQLQSFIMEADSFVVSHAKETEKSPFLKVLIDNPIKLYQYAINRASTPMMMGAAGAGMAGAMIGAGIGGGTKKVYYYGSNPENLTKLERKTFIAIMSDILADKPEVVAKIKDKTFKYGSIDDLLIYYKTGKMPVEEVYTEYY